MRYDKRERNNCTDRAQGSQENNNINVKTVKKKNGKINHKNQIRCQWIAGHTVWSI